MSGADYSRFHFKCDFCSLYVYINIYYIYNVYVFYIYTYMCYIYIYINDVCIYIHIYIYIIVIIPLWGNGRGSKTITKLVESLLTAGFMMDISNINTYWHLNGLMHRIAPIFIQRGPSFWVSIFPQQHVLILSGAVQENICKLNQPNRACHMGHGQYLVCIIALSHIFFESVSSFFRFWHISKCYRFLKSVRSFSKRQLNF